jgi:hypothetical protein
VAEWSIAPVLKTGRLSRASWVRIPPPPPDRLRIQIATGVFLANPTRHPSATLTPPAWWQFEWLAALGFWLSALPSFVIYKFDTFFAANAHLRDPAAGFFILVEVLFLALGTYKLVALFVL